MRLSLSTTWSNAHFYAQPKWSPSENLKLFGKCYSPDRYGHGHDYRLEVSWDSQWSDKIEGLNQTLTALASELDHKHLNHEINEFESLIPTTENLAYFCLRELTTLCQQKHLPPPSGLKLYERNDLWVEIFPDPLPSV